MRQPSEEMGEQNLKSASPKEGGRGLGYLWDKEVGWSEVWGAWGKMIGNKKKVR